MARNDRSDQGGSSRNQGGRSQGGAGGKQASDSTRSQGSGDMSVREAGHKGGQRVSELVEKGKQKET